MYVNETVRANIQVVGLPLYSKGDRRNVSARGGRCHVCPTVHVHTFEGVSMNQVGLFLF